MSHIYLKTAKSYVRRSPFQAMAATFVLATTFFVATVIGVLIYSSDQALKYFETRPQIIAFLKSDALEEDVSQLQSKLASDKRVKSVKYVPKEEALEIYKRATSDNPLLSELVSPAIFPASIEFSVTELSYAQSVIDEVKTDVSVEEVGFTANLGDQESINKVIEKLRKATYFIRIGGVTLALFLLGTSFMVLAIIISLRLSNRKNEMDVLDLIGATPGFIRSPIIIESLIYVVLGLIIGWTIALIMVLYFTPSTVKYFSEVPILPKDTVGLLTLFGALFIILLSIGIFLALSGSMLALSRKKRKP